MQTRRHVLGLTVASLAGGCATAELSLSVAEMTQIRIAGTDVTYEPDVRFQWETAEEEFLATRPLPKKKAPAGAVLVSEGNEALTAAAAAAAARSEAARTPEGQAFLKAKLEAKLRAAYARDLQPHFPGQRPVRIVDHLHGFIVPSTAQRVVLGGTPMLLAVTYLKEDGSGRQLGKLDAVTGAASGQGWLALADAAMMPAVEDRLIANHVEKVKGWLTARRG